MSACDPVPALASPNGEVVEVVPYTVEKGALDSHSDTLDVGMNHHSNRAAVVRQRQFPHPTPFALSEVEGLH